MKSSAKDFCLCFTSFAIYFKNSVFPELTHARILTGQSSNPVNIHFHFPNLQVLSLESRFFCSKDLRIGLLAKVYPKLTCLSLDGFRLPARANGDWSFVNLTTFHFDGRLCVVSLLKLLKMLPATLVTLSISDIMREREENFLEDSWVEFFCNKFKHLQDIAAGNKQIDVVSDFLGLQ